MDSSSKRIRRSRLKPDYQTLEPRQLLACLPAGDLNSGVAVSDDATGQGFIFYSVEDVHTRFSGMPADNADHFFAARYDGSQLQYNNDSQWIDFERQLGDLEVAEAFFGSDRVAPISSLLPRENFDLWFRADYYNGVPNDGEFEIYGTCIGEILDPPPEPIVNNVSADRLSKLRIGYFFYESVNQEFPKIATFDDTGTPLLSWRVQLLPFLGYDDLYRQFNLDEAWDSPHNLALVDQMPIEFQSPHVPSNRLTTFMGVGGADTAFRLDGQSLKYNSFTDPQQQTILLVEANPERAIEWTRPVDVYFNPTNPFDGIGNATPDGFEAVLMDGTSITIPSTVSPVALSNMLKISDGNFVDMRNLVEPQDPFDNLNTLSLAALNYESAFRDFPNQAIYSADDTTPLLSWRVSLLRFMGYNDLYEQFHLDEAWDSPHNLSLLPMMPTEFAHADIANGFTSYLAVSGPGTMFEIDPDFEISFDQVFDSHESTLLFVLADTDQAVEWTRPSDFLFDPADPTAGLGTIESDGFSGAFVTGETGFVPNSEPDSNVANMMLRDDMQFVDLSNINPYNVVDQNLRQIALAMHNYESAHQRFPTQTFESPQTGEPLLSWRVSILPFLGHNSLYNQFNLLEAWDSPTNLALLPLMPRTFATEGLPTGFTNYLVPLGDNTMFRTDQVGVSFSSVTDGPQNTVLLVEADHSQAVEWTRPVDLVFDAANPKNGLGAQFSGGFNVAFADASREHIAPTVSDETVALLMQRNDGQTIDADFIPMESLYARRPQINNQLRQITLAALNYESAYMEFPKHAIYDQPAKTTPLLSWRVSLLPFLGYSGLYNQFNLDEAWDSPNNLALIPLMPREFSHPLVENGMTVFEGVTSELHSGPSTMFPLDPNFDVDFGNITDGSSNTIFVVEADIDKAVIWTQPVDLLFNETDPSDGMGEAFASGFAASFADGSVRFIQDCISPETLGNLLLRNDGNVISGNNSLCNTGTVVPTGQESGNTTLIGDVGLGIGVSDNATGYGYLMFSAQDVFERFQAAPPVAGNSRHLIAIRETEAGGWEYNNNTSWIGFSPTQNDRILAGVEFGTDFIQVADYFNGIYKGLQTGFSGNNLSFHANQWDGASNTGEYQVLGTYFDAETFQDVGELNHGVAVQDDATGNGFIMFSPTSVHHRFAGVFPGSSDQFIAVRWSSPNQWQYNTNEEWLNFVPEDGDRVVAALDFGNDTVYSLQGEDAFYYGMGYGFTDGYLQFEANQWGGATDIGEFEIIGELFSSNAPHELGFGFGIGVDDDATGSGYLMHSKTNIHSRFSSAAPIAQNHDHLIAIRFEAGNWEYNTNTQWVVFTPFETDRILASVDFDNDTVESLQGIDSTIGGISAGFIGGNLAMVANQFAGVPNSGEFQITGGYFTTPYQVPVSTLPQTQIGELGSGIAVDDHATGTGFILYSSQNVFDRLGLVEAGNSEHLIAVRFDGNAWQYNTNSSWQAFVPAESDILLASVDFDSDTITSLSGESGFENGIVKGFVESDLAFFANRWNGTGNGGEFQVVGTYFKSELPTNVGSVGDGVAVFDDATGTGYLMYSEQNTHGRFGLISQNSDHFVAVRYDGDNWQYNNNSAWKNFTPEFGDRLMAEVDFDADTVQALQGETGVIEGIALGYKTSDLRYLANQWAGVGNSGEFMVTGTFFNAERTESLGPAAPGIAVDDFATGSGYILYTRESVHTRFQSSPPNQLNHDHLIAVRNSGQGWQYNNNVTWVNFEIQDGDRLLAAVDFSADTITPLRGQRGMVDGVSLGFDDGDLTFFANQWDGVGNTGEFDVTGSYFTF